MLPPRASPVSVKLDKGLDFPLVKSIRSIGDKGENCEGGERNPISVPSSFDSTPCIEIILLGDMSRSYMGAQ